MDYIYLDNAATTRTSDAVNVEMVRVQSNLFYNSAALYSPSLAVKNEIIRAADIIKQRLTKSSKGEIIFTSGATESNNMVILGKITHKSHHLLVLTGEHSSSYAPAKHLKDRGFEVDFIPLKPDGGADIDTLKKLIKPNTALVVFGLVNSDTGCTQNAAEIVRAVRFVNKTTVIHCDATQAFCKHHFDAGILGFDSVAISAHKICGPKGIGALWIREGINFHPIMFGGGQQNLRPGTENNAAVLGFAKAVQMWDTDKNLAHVTELHKRLVRGLPAGCTVNGKNNNPFITNIQLPGILGQTVMNALCSAGICVGLGSACASTATKNRTLLGMGIPEAKTKQVLRVSFGPDNTFTDVDKFLTELSNTIILLS